MLKRGIALTPVKFGISFTLTHLNQAGALVNVYRDGSVGLNHGGTEMGQGLHAKVAQVAARSFGVGLDRVRVSATDTSKVPNTSATAASSGSDLNGMAVKVGCEEIKTRMTRFLAHAHGVRTRQIAFRDGEVHVGGVILSFAEAVEACYLGRVSLSAAGYYRTPGLDWDRAKGQGHPFFYFAYGAAITEVALDTLTGEYRMLRADILHDVGESLNPAIDMGQIEGGYVQGVGWLTTEELVWDKAGRLATHAPSTYKIPAASDAPEVFNVTLWGKPNEADTVLSLESGGRAAADARDLGLDGAVGRGRRLRHALPGARRARRRPNGCSGRSRRSAGELRHRSGSRGPSPRTGPSCGWWWPRCRARPRARWGRRCWSGTAGRTAPSAAARWNTRPPRCRARDAGGAARRRRFARAILGPDMGQCCGGAVALALETFRERAGGGRRCFAPAGRGGRGRARRDRPRRRSA